MREEGCDRKGVGGSDSYLPHPGMHAAQSG